MLDVLAWIVLIVLILSTVSASCRFRKLYPFDSQSPTNQNMIAE